MSAYLGQQSAAQMRNATTPKDPTTVIAMTDTKAMEKRVMMWTSVLEILVTSTQCAEIQTVRTPAAVKPVSKDTESGVTTMTSAWEVFMIATKKPYVWIHRDRIAVRVPEGIMEMVKSVKVRGSVISDTVKIPGVGEFLVELCQPVLQIQTLFQTKISHFPHPFSDLASESCN